VAKIRLDRLLVKRRLANNKEQARTLIEAGVVLVGGFSITKRAAQVDAGADVRIASIEHRWVSRGAYKLLAALDAFAIEPAGLVAMDVGASTGGFTEVLLERGASKVFAVDVGYGQLAWSLQQDQRVIVLDRTNIRSLSSEQLGESIDIAVIDASFISLTLILSNVASLMGRGGGKPIVALIKPQFEARKDQVGSGGVVVDEAVRHGCIDKVRSWAKARDFGVGEVLESPIRGPAGNIEYLIELRSPGAGS